MTTFEAGGAAARESDYEQIGLLVPSRRSSAGHRLYDTADVARLYRISLLRRLRFPLDQVQSVLEDPRWELTAAVARHLAETRRKAASAARLSAQLASMAVELACAWPPARSTPDQRRPAARNQGSRRPSYQAGGPAGPAQPAAGRTFIILTAWERPSARYRS
jgi:DNA-binding transcriptional MerR regulator